MTRDTIDQFIDQHGNNKSIRMEFSDGTSKIGYFENLIGDHYALWKNNKHRIVESHNNDDYQNSLTSDEMVVQPQVEAYTTIINGDDIVNLSLQ